MSSDVVLIDREMLLAELQSAFDDQTAEVLLDVLDKVAAQVHAFGATREGIIELKQAVDELAEARRQTDLVLKELAQEVKGLAEVQRQTNREVKGLAEAQARTERTLKQLSRQVGGLSETVGGDIEDIAYIVLYDVLKREFGWEVGVLERSWQKWGDQLEEVDVFGQANDPACPGRTIWIVGEAKHNLTRREVSRFTRRVERAKKHLIGEVFAVCFCYRAHPEVQQRVLDAGMRLVFSYGKLV